MSNESSVSPSTSTTANVPSLKEDFSDSSFITISPPSYSVRELPDGKFYNETLNLSWPSRPKEGYYSAKEFYQRKAEMKKFQKEKSMAFLKNATNENAQNFSSLFPPDFLEDNTTKAAKWFLGTVSPLTAAEKVKNEPELCDVGIIRKPILLYKNHGGIVYLFPLSYDDVSGLWQLSFFTYHTPTFGRLKHLVDYLYSVGNIDPSNGRVEHLPYWIVNEAIEWN
uniref:Uncharacterized protein n=1 Tax=Panagrolaimus superbus TaxID=310955 RepID=A0A914YZ74_9BILA